MNKTNSKLDVLLVGYEEEENLGIRSIAAFLNHNGVKTDVEPYLDNFKDNILQRILEDQPAIVGFSLMFQRMLPDFANLIKYLRENEVKSHFTIGGHYPTIEYKGTLEAIPQINTVIRHEGEETFLELYKFLNDPDLWFKIKGMAFRNGKELKATPPRPLIKNLDSLPFIMRNKEPEKYRGLGVGSILASRGCYYNCSFCSVHKFYKDAPGSKKRSRTPLNVVLEMENLYKKGVKIFSFKDEDLGTKTTEQKEWIKNFAYELRKRDFASKILWRISCRVDEVNKNLLLELKNVGLSFVYLGIESGNKTGLNVFNKHYQPEDIYRALNTLDEISMDFEYGFMLFEPDCTFDTIMKDIDFLKILCKNGKVPVHFTKMFPYVGTSLFLQLKKEGRLIGPPESPDYRYLDKRIELLETFFSQVLYNTLFEKNGVTNLLQKAKFDSVVLKKFYSNLYDVKSYSESVRDLIIIYNDSVLNIMYKAVNFMKNKEYADILYNWDILEILVHDMLNTEMNIKNELETLKPV